MLGSSTLTAARGGSAAANCCLCQQKAPGGGYALGGSQCISSQNTPEGGALLEAEVVQGSQLEGLGQHQLPGGGLRGAVLAVGVQHVNHRLCRHLLSSRQGAVWYLRPMYKSAYRSVVPSQGSMSIIVLLQPFSWQTQGRHLVPHRVHVALQLANL